MNRSQLLTSLVLLAAAGSVAAQASNRPNTLSGPGRYVFGQINEFAADQYLLDTLTGRLWRLVDTVDGNSSVLEPVPFLLPDGRSQMLPPTAAAEAEAQQPAPFLPTPLDPLLREDD